MRSETNVRALGGFFGDRSSQIATMLDILCTAPTRGAEASIDGRI